MSEKKYDFPIYGTQGGGLVRWVNEKRRYVFVEKPVCPGLEVGDEMPEEWGVIPANEYARQIVEQEEGMFDALDEYLTDGGEMTFGEAERIFRSEFLKR